MFGLALILWISLVFSAYDDVIAPINSAPRLTFLAVFVICAARLDYSSRSPGIILAALLFGGVFAVVEGLWVWHLIGKPYPEFRSVGHVNHSSMYTLVTLSAGLSALYANQKWLRLLGLMAITSTLAFLPPSRSLVGGVAITAMLVVTILLIYYFSFFVNVLNRWESVDAVGRALSVGVMLTAIGFFVARLGKTAMMNEHG